MSSFIHATEDPERVVVACKNILPDAYRDRVPFNRTALRGHHYNPIILLQARINDQAIIASFIEELSSRLDEGDKRYLASHIERYIDDKGALYLRIDKQAAHGSRLQLGRHDTIRIKIRLRKSPKRLEDVKAVYQRLKIV